MQKAIFSRRGSFLSKSKMSSLYLVPVAVQRVRGLASCRKFVFFKPLISTEPRHEKTCFLHMQNQRRRSAAQLPIRAFVFSLLSSPSTSQIWNFKPLTIFYDCTARFVSDLVKNPKTGFLTTRLNNKNLKSTLLPSVSARLHPP